MLFKSGLTTLASLTLLLSACAGKPQEHSMPRVAWAQEGGGSAAQSGVPTTAAGAGAPAPDPGPMAGSYVLPVGGVGANQPGGTAGTPLKESECARQDLTATRIIPTVWLVIDGSGSMVNLLDDKDMASPSRWGALRGALMDPTSGLVKVLEHDVKFGMVMFDGPLPANVPIRLPDGGVAMFSSGPATTCPRLVDVEPALENFDAIEKAYTLDPLGGSTPTDKALEQVINHLPNAAQAGPDTMVQPTIVVLATDGEPNDYCSMSFPPPDVRPDVIKAVQQLVANGNKTYVISLAGSDSGLMQFCGEVAQAGGTGKPAYVPSSKDALVQAFRDIIGPGVACDVHLNGMVKPGMECKGTVQLDGASLDCNSDNGWRLKDASTLTITGDACSKLRQASNAYLHANFPCEVIELR